MKIKKDWWLANSIFLFISALLIIVSGLESGNLSKVLFSGGIEFLLGLALLQRSQIVFWIILIMTIYRSVEFFTNNIPNYQPNFYSFPFLIVVAKLAFILMLWQQIRKEEKKK